MALHSKDALKTDPLKLWQEMESKTALGYVPGQQFPGQFGHVMGGYQAGYYSYMWFEVIALDMLSAFGDQLMDKKSVRIIAIRSWRKADKTWRADGERLSGS